MEEIKSIRVRELSSYNLDFKLTLFRINNNKRKVVVYPQSRLPEMNFGRRWRNYEDGPINSVGTSGVSSIIDEYLSTMNKLGNLSKDYEIIQDPWLETVPKKRSFGSEPYYLNNGSRLYIDWVKGSFNAGGTKWSDDLGNELSETGGGDDKTSITKTLKIISPSDVDEPILTVLNGQIIEYDLNGTEFSGFMLDKDIIRSVINRWKLKVPNYNLELCEPSNEFCNIIEYKSPLVVEDLPDDKEDNKPPEDEQDTTPAKEKLSIVIPSDIKVKVKEDISIKIYVGDPPITNTNLPGFDFGDEFGDDISLLSDEYTEEGFEGEETTVIEGNPVMLFNTVELERDEGGDFDSGEVSTGSNNINTPNSPVSTSSISLPADLKGVQNSNIITKQSLGNSKYRPINKNIIAPNGDKINGSDIVRNMNQFVQDVLGPFSTFLKTNYPSLYSSWYITSATRGYIPRGGSTRSQHLRGQAVDSQILGSRSNNPGKNIDLLNAILEWYQSNPVGYGQILFETRGKSCWIHWSYSRSYNKLQLLRFKSDRTLRTAQVNTTGSYVLPPVNSSLLGLA